MQIVIQLVIQLENECRGFGCRRSYLIITELDNCGKIIQLLQKLKNVIKVVMSIAVKLQIIRIVLYIKKIII